MSSVISKNFAKRIKSLRKKYCFSQESFAEKCGVDSSYIGRLERMERSPSLDTLARIADGLGVKVHDLINFEKELEL